MKKNIFVSFISYAIINIICYLTFLFVVAPVIDIYISIYLQLVISVIHILFVCFLYFLAGKKYFIITGNRFADLISVWWVSLVLLIYNVLAHWVIISNKLVDIGFFINTISISFGFAFIALFQELCDIDPSFVVVLISPIIPSFGLWLGLERKKRKHINTPASR